VSTRYIPGNRHQRETFVGGEWVIPESGSHIEVIAPTTEESLGVVALADVAAADQALRAAREAFDRGPWQYMSFAERAGYVAAIADALENLGEDADLTLTAEMGAPLRTSLGSRRLAVAIARDYVELAKTLQFEENRDAPGGTARILKEPVGVTVAIIPFNGLLPLAMVKLAPALLAGCTVIVKPAPETAFLGLILAEVIESVNLPKGVVSVITGGREVGQHLVESPLVDRIAFTGSEVAGKKIMEIASRRMVRTTLELGGKSAAIILDDADIDDVIANLVPHAIRNAGQVCRALSRVIVSERRHD